MKSHEHQCISPVCDFRGCDFRGAATTTKITTQELLTQLGNSISVHCIAHCDAGMDTDNHLCDALSMNVLSH